MAAKTKEQKKAEKAAKAENRTSLMPAVGAASDSALSRVLDVQVVRRETLDAAKDALVDALLNDDAQMVAKHTAARERVLASTKALEAHVRKGQEVLA